MTVYTAVATLDRMAPPDDDMVEEVLTGLRELGGTLAADEWNRLQILCTVHAPTMLAALDATRAALAPWPDQVKVELLDEGEFLAWSHHASYATVTEAAKATGTSRQSILKRIHRGTLPARRRGSRWAIPWTALTPS